MLTDYFQNDFYKINLDDVEKAIEVAGRAFQEDPFTKYVYPDLEERKQKLKYGFYMIYQYGIRHGVTYAISSDLEGMVIWLPPDRIYPSFWEMIKFGGFYSIRHVGLKMKAMRTSIAIFSYEEKVHKRLVPYEHWYLQNIAVEPEEQGRGYGGQLLKSMIDQIDDERLPIYLETNNEKNLSFYHRFGFEVIKHEIIPNTDVPLWCMLRKPIKIRTD